MSVDNHEKQQIILIEAWIAGTRYYNADSVMEEIRAGLQLQLKRESSNFSSFPRSRVPLQQRSIAINPAACIVSSTGITPTLMISSLNTSSAWCPFLSKLKLTVAFMRQLGKVQSLQKPLGFLLL